MSGAAERLDLGARGAADERAHRERGAQHRGGLAAQDELEAIGVGPGGEPAHVLGLAADEQARARRHGELERQVAEQGGAVAVAAGEELEGERDQRVAREQGGRLVEGLVAGRSAAPQVGVVHARQVVMDQGVRMDALERDGGGAGVAGRVEGARRRQGDHGPEAFAAGLQRVAHRGVEPGRAGVRGRGQGTKGRLHLADQACVEGLEPGAIHGLTPRLRRGGRTSPCGRRCR